jgi:fatty acid desaturase
MTLATPEASLGPVRITRPARADRANPTSLYSELLKTVRDLGLLRRRRGFYITTFSVITLALAGALTGFFLLGQSWFQLLIAAALGIIATQFAFIAHEAAHRQIFESGKSNDWAGILIGNGLVGMSFHYWNHKHSRHHTKPNTINADPDITSYWVAFDPDERERRLGWRDKLARVQGWLLFPFLLFLGLALYVDSVKALVRDSRVHHRWAELGLLAARHIGWSTVVILFLGWGMGAAFLGVQVAVFGFYMGASFAPNHKGMAIISEREEIDFFRRQVLTSRNISGAGTTTLMGGLNYQVEHHLFPNMARPHLKKAAAVVREYCEKHNVPYTQTTLFESYRQVVGYLNRVGLRDADPFHCPVVASTRLH